MNGQTHIGTSGYQYKHWKGILYPEKLPQKDWLPYYAQNFQTVEINNSFYKLPESQTLAHWRDQTPAEFLFAMKFSRYGSHMKRLKPPYDYISLFLERVEVLEDSLGPILIQLPEHFHKDSKRLSDFLKQLPSDFQWAMEFRHSSWLTPEIYELLDHHDVAMVKHDLLSMPKEFPANWFYQRFHGGNQKGKYSPQQLSAQARKLEKEIKQRKDLYIYFNNDMNGYAVEDANNLIRYIRRT